MARRVKANNPVERAVDKARTEHGSSRDRGFLVGVGLPGVHGREAGLGAVAEENHDEGQAHGVGIELVRIGDEHRPIEAAGSVVAYDIDGGIIGENGAKEGESDADTADDDVFPAGFERGFAIVEGDQEHRGEGGAFDGDPHDPQVIGYGDQQHGADKERGEDVVAVQLPKGNPVVTLVLRGSSRWRRYRKPGKRRRSSR